MCLIKCVSLIEERAFSLGPELHVLLGLDRVFSLGLHRAIHSLALPRRLEIQGVDVGLSLASARDFQKAVDLERFEVLADVRFVQPHVLR